MAFSNNLSKKSFKMVFEKYKKIFNAFFGDIDYKQLFKLFDED